MDGLWFFLGSRGPKRQGSIKPLEFQTSWNANLATLGNKLLFKLVGG
jgi:hypothetical protein